MSNTVLNTNTIEHISTIDVVTEEDLTWVLEYYVLTMQGVADEVFYSLKVDKCTPLGEIVESETTYAITEDYTVVRDMAIAFCKGMVFPINVSELVDEWMD